MTTLRDEVLLRLSSGHAGVHTQRELAPLIGVTPSQLSRILANPHRRLGPGQAEAFAGFLGVSVDALIDILREDHRASPAVAPVSADAPSPRGAAVQAPGPFAASWSADARLDPTVQVRGAERDAMLEVLSQRLRDMHRRVAQLERMMAHTGPIRSVDDRRASGASRTERVDES